MGSHDPFGYLKHKLWQKEKSRIKLTIWLLTTKSQESPQFPCVKVAWDRSLESSRQEVQLCFRAHLNRRFAHKVMGPKVVGVPVVGILGLPLGSPETKWHLNVGLVAKTEYTIRGKVVASPKSGPWWVLWVRVCPWFVRAPKCSNYALTNLLFILCRLMWISELLVIFPSSILELQHTPLPPKCFKLGSSPQLHFLLLSSLLESQLNPSRSLGVRHLHFEGDVCENWMETITSPKHFQHL
jgi:hypothetical protein